MCTSLCSSLAITLPPCFLELDGIFRHDTSLWAQKGCQSMDETLQEIWGYLPLLLFCNETSNFPAELVIFPEILIFPVVFMLWTVMDNLLYSLHAHFQESSPSAGWWKKVNLNWLSSSTLLSYEAPVFCRESSTFPHSLKGTTHPFKLPKNIWI